MRCGMMNGGPKQGDDGDHRCRIVVGGNLRLKNTNRTESRKNLSLFQPSSYTACSSPSSVGCTHFQPIFENQISFPPFSPHSLLLPPYYASPSCFIMPITCYRSPCTHSFIPSSPITYRIALLYLLLRMILKTINKHL